jgi:hypothetical protein
MAWHRDDITAAAATGARPPVGGGGFPRRLTRYSLLLALPLTGLISPPAVAAGGLQELSDQGLSQISGQDGISVQVTHDGIALDRLYWQDRTGGADNSDLTLRGYAETVAITGTNLVSTLRLDLGKEVATTKAGMNLALSTDLGTVSAQNFRVCDAAGANCGDSLAGLTVQTQPGYPLALGLRTSEGIFNENARAELTMGVRNVNMFVTQTASDGKRNQFILKDFSFSFEGGGYAWISPDRGLVLETRADDPAQNYIDLARVTDAAYPTKTKPGLNLEFLYKGDAGATYDLTGTRGLLRGGISGRMTNAFLVLRGVDASGLGNSDPAAPANVMGFSYSETDTAGTGANATIIGASGLALRFKADFSRTGSNPVTLELAHAGSNAYGVEFGNLSPLLIRKSTSGSSPPLNPDLAYLDSGNIYLNLASTRRMQLPVNEVLNAAPLGAGKLTTSSDYLHQVHNLSTNPKMVAVAVRGTDFQAIARSSRFIVSNDVTNAADLPVAGGTWSLALPFHDLNANIALYGITVAGDQRIGAAFALSTRGRNADGSKTTSILLIDGAPNANDLACAGGCPTNYYVGLRNIDLMMAGYGSIGLENGAVNLDIGQFSLAAAAEFAAGYLPGSKKVSLNAYAPVDGFIKSDDVLFGIKTRLAGSAALQLVPGDNSSLATNSIGFNGRLNLTGGAVQLVDPFDASIMGFDTLNGTLDMANRIRVRKDSVDFNYALDINPADVATGVFRMRDVQMYPVGGAGQRLGEMVLTGGQLVTNINLKPR